MNFISGVAQRLTARYGVDITLIRLSTDVINYDTGVKTTNSINKSTKAIVLEAADYFSNYYGDLFSKKAENVQTLIESVDRVVIVPTVVWQFQPNDYIAIQDKRYTVVKLEKYDNQATIAMIKHTAANKINITISENITSTIMGVDQC